MFLLKMRLRFHFSKHVKLHKKLKKKDAFNDEIDGLFVSAIERECKCGYIKGAPKDALRNLLKDTQEGAFEVALKESLQGALALHLYCTCWCTHKFAKLHKIIQWWN